MALYELRKYPNDFNIVSLILYYDFLRHHKFIDSTSLMMFHCLRILKTFKNIKFNDSKKSS